MDRRLTRQRQTILEVLRRRMDHPTAEQLFQELRLTLPHISLGTVYRNLDVLQTTGLIRVVPGEPRRFDGNRAAHDHFRCLVCGALLDLPSGFIPEPTGVLPGCTVQARIAELVGICDRCNSGKQADGSRILPGNEGL